MLSPGSLFLKLLQLKLYYMDYVLLSPNDGELLKKAHQMLLEGGVKDDVNWNSRHNPDLENTEMVLSGRLIWNYALSIDEGALCFFNHNCTPKTPIHITPENLAESVVTVLNDYKNAQS